MGCELIRPHMMLDGRIPKVTKQGSRNILKGINYLQAVTAYNPSNWNAFWIVGKGYQTIGDHEKAYQSFKIAYQIHDKNPNVAREYADSCMRLGFGPEAVTVAMSAVETDPKDAGLHANLALAYLIAAENSYAQKAIQYALEMNPNDQISRRLQNLIYDVVNGRKAQPKNLAELK